MTLHIRSLSLQLTLEKDAFSRPNKPQPCLITLSLKLPIMPPACRTDSISDTFSYASVVSALSTNLPNQTFSNIDAIGIEIGRLAAHNNWPGTRLEINVLLPKAVLGAEGGLEFSCTFKGEVAMQWAHKEEATVSNFSNTYLGATYWLPFGHPTYHVRSVSLAARIGINAYEREQKQPLLLDVTFELLDPITSNSSAVQPSISRMTAGATAYVGASNFLTVEALAHYLATVVLKEYRELACVTVKIEKTAIYNSVGGVGFEVRLYRYQVDEPKPATPPREDRKLKHEFWPNSDNEDEEEEEEEERKEVGEAELEQKVDQGLTS